jgi:transposase-like protein
LVAARLPPHGRSTVWRRPATGCSASRTCRGANGIARTTNAIERLHEEFKRRIKTQTVLPSAETAAMLFWALMASGQIIMRKIGGWQTLATKPVDHQVDLGA